MDIDPSEVQKRTKPDILRNLSSNGPLRTSLSKLSGSSRVIPSEKDFHFYNNFQEFKAPVEEIDEKSKTLLQLIGSSETLFNKRLPFPDDKAVELDDDVAFDWLVTVNDETFERLDISLDEFQRIRKGEEATGVRVMKVADDGEDGFQMVCGKKKNKTSLGGLEKAVEMKGSVQEVKVATKAKPKVPFHVPTIPRPQDEYKIIVNNANQPFEHVWLQKSEDGSRFLHPLEKLSVLDFVDTSDCNSEPLKPPPLDATPFKLVEDVKELKQLAVKLRSVDEFAVDLEHNQYRSFQGMTCLMQISTRKEDFIIDTLKLRIHVGPYLRELFKDPTKRKVMHGADRDIFWLQRDFGIYVCNMFDTGQASRVLKLERYSLEYLLNHICGVEANKEYQNADWRIRQLPREMIKYAREDTHYLLYIYDVMRRMLLTSSAESDSSDPPLVEVYKRSYDLCIQLYEKELLTDTSYQYIYGVQSSDFNAQQLAIVSGLCEWRDVVARSEDESTGYVLPNRTLIDIAKQMPISIGQLRRVLKSRHPYIERNLDSVISIVRHSIHNAAAFEDAAKHLKERRLELANKENIVSMEESEVPSSDAPDIAIDTVEDEDLADSSSPDNNTSEAQTTFVQKEALPVHEQPKTTNNNLSTNSAVATVQILKKPTRAFGAMLGASKRKFDSDTRGHDVSKLEHIKSTVSLPFHTFQGRTEESGSKAEEPVKKLVPEKVDVPAPATGSTLEDVIILDDDDDGDDAKEEPTKDGPLSSGQLENKNENENEPKTADSSSDIDEEDEPMSLSDLTSSFQKVLPSPDQTKSSKTAGRSQGLPNFKPFDYDAAREQVKFGQQPRPRTEEDSNIKSRKDGKKSSIVAQSGKDTEGTPDLLQGKRRLAFPASGNRSATFR